MRDIKFRVWDAKSKRIRSVIMHEILDYDDVGRDQVESIYVFPKPHHVFDASKDFFVMQFTGLLDSKGKEIYEGDIVRAKQYEEPEVIGKIVFITSPCCFCIELVSKEQDGEGLYYSLGHKGQKLEVIGNIYENPSDLILD